MSFRCVMTLLLLPLLASPAAAQSAEAKNPPDRGGEESTPIEELERRVEELEAALARRRAGDEEEGEGDAEEEAPQPPAAGGEDGQPWEVGYKGNGGGFFLRSPDGKTQLRMLAYAQFLASYLHDDFVRADAPGDFSIRRARVDWLANYGERYQFFLEIDGGPGSVPGSSDFALVEAKLTAQLLGNDLMFTGGKYVSPFSTENLLSSRSLDTVERYIALNSMFLLPGLDVQFGAMLHGKVLADDRLEYFVGVFNGNGRANDNLSDDNGEKEVQLKLNLRPTDALKLGLGFDRTREEEQSLQLRGLSFTPWVAVPVAGERRGVTADFAWERGRLSLRGEGLWFDFPDAAAELAGGFVQAGYFVSGDSGRGFQPLLRLETASLSDDRIELAGDRIDAVTLGLNFFWAGNVRLQLDLVGERYNGPSNLPAGASRVDGEGWKPYLLTELQLKF